MNDLDKFKNLFNDIGIPFNIEDNILTIEDGFHEDPTIYIQELSIYFDNNGKFEGFYPIGD